MSSGSWHPAAPGGDLSELREQNARRVLGALRADRDGLTQLEIVVRTGLSRTTVSSLLAELRPVLRQQQAAGGRGAKRWCIDRRAAFSIGVDVGQAHISVALSDPFGDLFEAPITRPFTDVLTRPHEALALASHLVENTIAEAKVRCADIAAVTVGVPGALDASTGKLTTDHATSAWAGIDVRDEVRKRWPQDEKAPAIFADNDANLGALAEQRAGAGQNTESMVFVKWSTGIGCGLILGCELWRGHSGVAGELGHVPVVISTKEEQVLRLSPRHRRPCPRCGHRDCLERLAGGETVAAAVGLPHLSEVVELALSRSAGSAQARRALKVAARLIGRAIGPALTLLNVERVVIGGIVGRSLYPLLVGDVSDGMAESAFPAARADASVSMGTLGSEAYVRGAAISGLEAHGVSALLLAAER